MSFPRFTGLKDDSANAPKTAPQTPPSVAVLQPTGAPRSDAYIGRGTKITGSLQFPGAVEIDCQVEGEIEGQDRLVVGESALIHARVRGGDVVVKGAIQGDVVATKRLTLKKGARVAGNISAPVLVIEEGALFEGKCSMASAENAESRTHISKSVVPLKPTQEKVA